MYPLGLIISWLPVLCGEPVAITTIQTGEADLVEPMAVFLSHGVVASISFRLTSAIVGNVPDVPLKCQEVTYILSIFTKRSNVGNIWDETSPNLCHLACIYVAMVCTSRTIHRINLYIRVSSSIACTNSTTPHDS